MDKTRRQSTLDHTSVILSHLAQTADHMYATWPLYMCDIVHYTNYNIIQTNKCNYPVNTMSKYIPPTTILKLIWRCHECLCATKCSDCLSVAAVTYMHCAARHSYIYHCINLLRSYHREYGTNGSCHTRQKFTVEYITAHQTLKKCNFYSLDIIFFSMQGHKQAVHLLVYK